MIISYNWLKEFVDVDLPVEELSHLLTMLGLEVERMETVGGNLDDVVVAVVEERNQHPNADKLSLCKVNNGIETLSIVCGAQNFKAGDKVALAQIGAVLPGDFKIKRSKIRGEESFGMLCSEKELGLADESAGIIVLPEDYPVGTPIFDAMGLKDTIFEIGLTPNRADCLSVLGIAREVAAKLGRKAHDPGHPVVEGQTDINKVASVTVEDAEYCPRYAARYISGCKIGPSPAWLANRLRSVGMRSINNVVDITNYVLMEYGHPLHAFDHDLLAGGKIVVRRAAEGEKFQTLDGQERVLSSTDLTIRDGEKAVALAGVMGGGNSEISDATINILLESAYFHPPAIRKTSKRLGLHTESSHRFERGADVGGVRRALDRAASLIADLAGGTVARGVIDVYPQAIAPKIVTLRVPRANAILGISLGDDEVTTILLSLAMGVERTEPGILQVKVPTYRVDIEREIDLIEEIARLKGYEEIPVTMPMSRVFSDRPSLHQRLQLRVRDIMVANGFSEVVNFSFIGSDSYDKILLPEGDFRRQSVPLLNAISDEMSVMRTSLLPGLVEVAARNLSHRILDQRLFEFRRVYLPRTDQKLPAEPLVIAGVLTGRRNPDGWNQSAGEVDFFDVKGVVETLLADLGIADVTYSVDVPEPFYHPGKAGFVSCGKTVIGSLGELHPDLLERYEIDQPVFYFELNFEKLAVMKRETATIVPPSRFPDTFRDIAMLIDTEIPATDIINAVKALRLREMEGVQIFDLYKGPNIPEDKKSIAIRVRYRSHERTLTDDEVSALHSKVIDGLTKKLDITTR